MKLLKVRLFSCVVAAVLIALLLTTAVAQAASRTVVKSPNPRVAGNELLAAASVSANDVWAVGEATTTTGQVTLAEHWNGPAWSIVSSPSPSSSTNLLDGAAADPSSGQAWAVGNFSAPGGMIDTLTEFNP